MASSTLTDSDRRPTGVDPQSVAATKPNEPPPGTEGTAQQDQGADDVDRAYWLRCLDDAERAEADFRRRGREIVQIYRNEKSKSTKKTAQGRITFNILYANTEVALPSIYTKPPVPIVRSRWTAPDKKKPPMGGFMPPPGGPTPLGPAPAPSLAAPPPPAPPAPPVAGPPIPPSGPVPLPSGVGAAAGPLAPPPMPPVSMGAGIGGGKPTQKDIETAASVMQKALEIVLSDEQSHESVKASVKDMLLPGRGVCRVRWKPTMKRVPVMAGDGLTPLPAPPGMGDNGGPPMEEIKVWEEVGDEYVYWEDILMDPVRAAGSTDWIAFRHLFTAQALEAEFAGNAQFDRVVEKGKLAELCRWTEESAAKDSVGGSMKTADKLGDVIKKAMVWEIWDRTNRRIIWMIREMGGIVLRVDEDTYGLTGFYPIPRPLLAVTTTDTQIPKAFYDLYEDLADDLDETSKRISKLTKQIKVRGAYNAANGDIKDILTADDNKMVGIAGIDMAQGGLAAHIWMVPIIDFVNALTKLIEARDVVKNVIYEVMGISDIMRGATKASETATAQRIKGSLGMVRLSDQKQQAANFVTDLLRMKGEIIGQNFDAATLSAMTGEDVTPEVMDILRSDFQRTCLIAIEDDSTVMPDEQAEQQGMAQVTQSIGLVMSGAAQMLQAGIFQPQQVALFSIELLKMILHPVRYSRGVIELLDDFSEQLEAQMAMMASMPPPPPPVPGLPPTQPGEPAQGGPPAPPPAPNGAMLPPPPGGGPPVKLQ